MKYPILLASAAVMAASAAPVIAQDAEDPPPIAILPAPDQEVSEDEEVFEFKTAEEEFSESLEQELTEAFAIFGEMFTADPLTPEQEARLPLAKQMTDKVFPEGSFAIVMEESMAPMMTMMMGAAAGDNRTELASLTGLEQSDIDELDDAAVEEALSVLDPKFAARTERLNEIVISMMGDLFAAIEPAYREGLARAFTTRFEAAEMTELLTFFDTPVGGKFAQQAFLVQYDPQMMSMMESMGPAMVEVFPKMMEEIVGMTAEFPEGRVYSELSAAERGRLSQLLGKGESELEALAPEREEIDDDEEEGVI